MTVSDLLDQVAFDAGDQGSDYRNASRRWLNLVRSYIADEGVWKSAMDPSATFTTSAATTTGIYTLTGYEFIAGDMLYDETSSAAIRHESFGTTNEIDPAKDTTGKPCWWSDAGMDTAGARQIYLWPIPDAAYVIRYPGYKVLSDLTTADDNLSVDPFFGRLISWAATFTAGLRYFHDQNNNEDMNQVIFAQRAFDVQIRRKKSQNRVSPTSPLSLRVIRTQSVANVGRFDPSHFNNRG